MADMKKPQTTGAPPPNVTSMPDRCPVEACGKSAKKLVFCEEHFAWFKEGLVNKKGERPSDFDKKFQHYKRKKAA
jgi:hypothetical protein